MRASVPSSAGVRVAFLVIAAACSLAARAVAQQVPLVARVDHGARVVTVNPITGAESRLYESDLSRGWVSEVRVAPSGRFVAVLETIRGGGRDDARAGLPRNRLVVLHANGRVASAIERDVRQFAWCCGAGTLAIITGAYYEGGEGFLPDSALLYDVVTGAETPLVVPVAPTEVVWAAFDSSVYFGARASDDSLNVWRYHFPTRILTQTSYRGLVFSPSGNHYLVFSYSTGRTSRPGWHAVERLSGRETALPGPSIGAIQGWVFASGDQLLLLRSEGPTPRPQGHRPQAVVRRVMTTRFAVFDLTSRRITQRGAGDLPAGTSASAGVVPIVRNGRLEVLRGPIP